MVWRKSRQNEWFKRGGEGKCRGGEKITKIAGGVMELWVHLPWVPWPLMAGDAVVTAVCMSHIQSPSHHHNHRCHFHHHHRCHHHCRFCHCHWPRHITPLNVFSSSMTSSTPSKCWPVLKQWTQCCGHRNLRSPLDDWTLWGAKDISQWKTKPKSRNPKI